MSYISAAQAKQIAQKAVDNLKDGTLIPKLSENWTPYAEDSGTTQTQPFFLEGTATGNGESRVDAKQVPAFAFLQEKRGNMVNVNQIVSSMIPSQQVGGLTITRDENGYLDISGTSDGTFVYNQKPISDNLPQKANHIYLVFRNKSFTNRWGMSGFNLNKTSDFFIHSHTADFSGKVALYVPDGENFNITGLKVYIVDLTQWFNGNIPAYLLSHPEAFGRYYKGSLAYEPGRLEPATGRYLTSVGRNIWDETWRNGYYDTQSGAYVYQASSICSEGNIKVSPNTAYCLYSNSTVGYFNVFEFDSNGAYIGLRQPANGVSFVTSANCQSITFGMPGAYGTTYNHDITISLYYSGESDYDKYYPHEVLATIDTGTEQLGFLDYKVPSGLITRPTGSVDLGTLTWTAYEHPTLGTYFYAYVQSLNIKRLYPYNVAYPMICAKYFCVGRNADDFVDKTFCADGDATTVLQLQFKDSAYTDVATFKTAMSGVMLYYELAEPTTEQGTPYQEKIPIDDFGPLSWSDTDVPQGNQIFYPVDYKAYEDTLIKYTDGDATSLALKNDITDAALNARGYYKMEDLSSGITSLVTGLTIISGKAYKQGNLVCLYLDLQNSSGATIAANTDLFSLSSSLAPLNRSGWKSYFVGISGNAEGKLTIASNNGSCSLPVYNDSHFICNIAYMAN